MTLRDKFLLELLEKAKKDDSIVLLSVDMGAPAIDSWKRELPNQYVEMGISEQNAINVAAGLSRGGKKVFVYFMAVWVHRCFEQIRYSCAIAGNPITILGNGVGLGYAPAGPAHAPNEDISVMKSLLNIEIYSPSTELQISNLVEICLTNKKLNYVRLERKTNVDYQKDISPYVSKKFDPFIFASTNTKHLEILVLSYGYISSYVYKAFLSLNEKEREKISFVDIQKIWPLDLEHLQKIIKQIKKIVFIEEQTANGSIFEFICRYLIGNKIYVETASLHLPQKYIFDNGNQDELLQKYGFSQSSIMNLLKV